MPDLDTHLLIAAQQHYQAGRLPEAAALYQQILVQQPDQIEVLSWLALIADRLGKPDDSIAYSERILALNPNSAETHSNLGSVLCQQGRLDAAIAHHQTALQLRPDNPDAHYNLGVVWATAGEVEAAIGHYQQAIALNPNYANAHNNLGVLLGQKGDRSAAINHYQQAIRLNPQHANAHNNLGVALFQERQIEAAIAHYRQAIAVTPEDANVYDNLGTALREQGKLEAAIASYQQAIRLAPHSPSAHDNLGTVFHDQGKLEAAIAHYRQAIALDPNYANPYNNLASALKEQGKLAEAIACCRQAIALEPNHADAHNNYGSALVEEGKLEEAIAHFEQAIRQKPQFASAHLNLGIVRLMQGDFAGGFPEYHWRWQTKQCPPLRYLDAFWDGSDLNGKVILLTAEQGYGDTIQFARYASIVAQRGGQVVFACPKPLLRLMETLPGIQRCVDRDRVDVQTHVHAPLLDLPMILGTTLETIPADIPYLAAAPTLTLPEPVPAKLKLGIVWASNPANSTSPKRSCPLRYFLELQALPDIVLYSLQKDVPESDRASLVSVIDLSDRLQDFADTAAAINQLDLVISVDTAVAHLAGALGKPVWTLLPTIPDWRWMLDRDDTPWYPTMRLFRQPQPGNWDAVFEQVTAALQAELSQAAPFAHYTLPATPETPIAHLRLGFACFKQGEFAAAIDQYQQALRLQPHYPEVHNNWGVALCQQGQIEAAMQQFEQAIVQQPDYAEAHLNLGMARLLLGELPAGFAEYHWRWRTGQTTLAFPEALWDGTTLKDKTILLTAEQGLGDTIQFIRYAALVKQFQGRVIVACQKPLMSLMATVPGVDRVIDRDTETAEIHVHAPLLELPRLLGTTIATIPAEVPYLQVPSGYAQPNFPTAALKVGLVWASHSTSPTAIQRSCPLTELLPLLNCPGVAFYSLQSQPSPAECRFLEAHGVRNLRDSLTDMGATAAIIAALDLVISIDTAVAHLAGALGKPIWTLLPAIADWRWLLARADSPWYPTMRLFRQPRAGDWSAVISQVVTALTEMAAIAIPVAAQTQDASLLSSLAPRLTSGRHGLLLDHPDTQPDSVLDLLQHLIQAGDWIVEVEAGIGAQTIFFAKAVGATGKVIALNSDRQQFQTLCANLALNNLTNTHPYHTPWADPLEPYLPPVANLPKTLERLALPRCRLFKLNRTEEPLRVLRSAQALLTHCQPLLYLDGSMPSMTELIRHLQILNYDLYWHRIPNLDSAYKTQANIFGVHPVHHLTIQGLAPIDLA